MENKEMEIALSKQMNVELWSSYLYLSMSYAMRHKGWLGTASWFEWQSREEMAHAHRIGAHILSMNGKVSFYPIAEVRQEWASPKEAFEDTLMHEKMVTTLINKLYEKAVTQKEYTSQVMLQWFITEQMEEEDTPRTILDAIRIISDDKAAMFMLDQKLGERKGE